MVSHQQQIGARQLIYPVGFLIGSARLAVGMSTSAGFLLQLFVIVAMIVIYSRHGSMAVATTPAAGYVYLRSHILYHQFRFLKPRMCLLWWMIQIMIMTSRLAFQFQLHLRRTPCKVLLRINSGEIVCRRPNSTPKTRIRSCMCHCCYMWRAC